MKYPVLGGPAESKINISNRMIWAVLLIISVGWGTSPVAVRIALREGLGPITIASASLMIAAAAVFALMAVLRRGMLTGRVEMRIGGGAWRCSACWCPSRCGTWRSKRLGGVRVPRQRADPVGHGGMAHFALSDEPLNAYTLAGDAGVRRRRLRQALRRRLSVLGVTAIQLAAGSIGLAALALVFEGVDSDPTTADGLGLLYVGDIRHVHPAGPLLPAGSDT